jgi:hypothetical protein
MKTKSFLYMALTFVVAFVFLPILAMFGQDTIPNVNPIEDGSLEQFVALYDLLYVAVVNILGYLHNWIPGLNAINAKWIRIVLIGAVVAVIFNLLGLSGGLSLVLLFLQAVGFYEIILKRAKPSPPANNRSSDI